MSNRLSFLPVNFIASSTAYSVRATSPSQLNAVQRRGMQINAGTFLGTPSERAAKLINPSPAMIEVAAKPVRCADSYGLINRRSVSTVVCLPILMRLKSGCSGLRR